jgi:omega-3 fatty acid desaturase (delta-15 desaturase)
MAIGTEGKATEKGAQKLPTLIDIKKQLPSSCFQPSTAKSISYVVRDVVIVSLLYFGYSWLLNNYPLWGYLLAPIYGIVQGTMFWAIFVLGHDCGHGSFSQNKLVNEIFGHLLHTFILVPYHPWRLSHRKHHKNTGHIDNDEIFYPWRVDKSNPEATKVPFYIEGIFMFGLGWIAYLVAGFDGGNSHFAVKNNRTYKKDHERAEALRSLVCWWTWFAFTLVWSFYVGIVSSILLYWIPIFVFSSWLVLVTFLHHNEGGTTWLSGEQWDYVAGNLITVDRTYGAIIDNIHHDIGTHVVHHLFPAIPHYNLKEADAALQTVLKEKQIKSDDNFLKAFFQNWKIYKDNMFVDQHEITHSYPPLEKTKSD